MSTPIQMTAVSLPSPASVTPISNFLSPSSFPSAADTNRTSNVSGTMAMKSSLPRSSSFTVSFSFSPCPTAPSLNLQGRRRRRMVSCEVVVESDSAASSSSSTSPVPEEAGKIGARVRVKGPLKVYHVPKVPELDLTGMEGHLKQYVGLWKGKKISANLPFKVQFVTEIEGRGPVKFFAHLREDEFEYL